MGSPSDFDTNGSGEHDGPRHNVDCRCGDRASGRITDSPQTQKTRQDTICDYDSAGLPPHVYETLIEMERMGLCDVLASEEATHNRVDRIKQEDAERPGPDPEWHDI